MRTFRSLVKHAPQPRRAVSMLSATHAVTAGPPDGAPDGPEPPSPNGMRPRARPAPASLRATRAAFRVVGALSSEAAARMALRLWCTPPRARPSLAEQAVLNEGTPYALTADGCALAAWSWGHGPLVVAVHGWGGHAGQFAALVGPLVDAGCRVVAFDAPAHGRSGAGSMGARRTTLLAFRQAIEAVVAREGQPHAVLAHSLGCTAAAWAMRVGRLTPRRAVFIAPATSPSAYARRFGRALGLREAVQRRWMALLAGRLDFGWDDLEAATVPDAAPTPPLLVVHDRDDRDTPWDGGRLVAERWPGAALHTTAGLGHRRVLRDPAVAALAAGFAAGGR